MDYRARKEGEHVETRTLAMFYPKELTSWSVELCWLVMLAVSTVLLALHLQEESS